MKKIIACILVVIILAFAILGYFFRYDLFKYLPSKSAENYEMRNGVYVEKTSGTPFTGRAKSVSENRTTIYSYKNGKFDGMDVAYENGKIVELGNWKDDKQNGEFKLFNDKGILVDHGIFKDGVRHGLTKQYYPESGKLRIEGIYKNGKMDGEVKSYYENGKIKEKWTYVDGELTGPSSAYFENGNIYIEMNYKNGAPIGKYKMFNETGKLVQDIDNIENYDVRKSQNNGI